MEMLAFTKVEKNPKTIEERINNFLEGKTFKWATQSESTTKGKFFISIFYDNKKSNIKAKVFKDMNKNSLNEKVNEFLDTGVNMKFATQSSSTSAIFLVVFYEPRKGSGKEDQKKD